MVNSVGGVVPGNRDRTELDTRRSVLTRGSNANQEFIGVKWLRPHPGMVLSSHVEELSNGDKLMVLTPRKLRDSNGKPEVIEVKFATPRHEPGQSIHVRDSNDCLIMSFKSAGPPASKRVQNSSDHGWLQALARLLGFGRRGETS